MTTALIQLPELATSQSQKEITHNQALAILDAVVQLSVESRVLGTPPGSPTQGGRYIIPAGATGVWAGQTNKIAHYVGSAYAFYTAREGWLADVRNEDLVYRFDGAAWVRLRGAYNVDAILTDGDGLLLDASGNLITNPEN